MSNVTPQPAPPAPSLPAPALKLDTLVRYKTQFNYAFLAAAVGFAVIPIYLLSRHSFQIVVLSPVFLWGVGLALINLVVGLVGINYNPEGKMSETDKLRLQFLAAGGLVGLATALLGAILPFSDYRSQIAEGLEAWGKKPRIIVIPALAFVGGLLLMFLSLQLGRGLERRNQSIRRLVYGYNAVLTTLLLLAVLALPNVLVYAEPFASVMNRPVDFTRTEVNSLAPVMRNLLADLKQPVKVYALLPRGTYYTSDTQTLLQNCRAVNNKITWELIDPTDPANYRTITTLMQKYSFQTTAGLLVVLEQEKDKSVSEFISLQELFRTRERDKAGRMVTYTYKGENALYNTLLSLTEGRVVFYFTQGHGEIPLTPSAGGRAQGPSLGELQRRLTERKKLEIRPLDLSRGKSPEIPKDADAVIVAGPSRPFSRQAQEALVGYLRRNRKEEKGKVTQTAGKVIFLLDPVIEPEGNTRKLRPTGLEQLMASYGVKLGQDRVLSLSNDANPTEVQARTQYPSSNPLAAAFWEQQGPFVRFAIFRFNDTRTVDAAPQAAKMSSSRVERLMTVPGAGQVWTVTDANVDPVQAAKTMRAADEEKQEELLIPRNGSLSIGVAVSDSADPGLPMDAAHSRMFRSRMIVFGSSSWITDRGLAGGMGELRFSLFSSSLSWLREKAALGEAIPDKERKKYELNVAKKDEGRLVYLPLALMILGIVGMGTGVWVVRRR